MRRREFLGFVGTAAAWPLAARAQQPDRMRRIGVLTGGSGQDSNARVEAFLKALAQLGWTEGQNIRLEIRRGSGDADAIREHAAELAALAPDVIMTIGGTATGRLLQATRTVPIVFAIVPDPVGSGFVASLSRPGGNATGFLQFEYDLSGKWLELLKEISPQVKRVGVLRASDTTGSAGQWAVIQAFSRAAGVELSPINVGNAAEIERGTTEFAGAPNGGLIVVVTSAAQIHREPIIAVAARHRLPAVYPYRSFAAAGGLISYGPDLLGQYRRTA